MESETYVFDPAGGLLNIAIETGIIVTYNYEFGETNSIIVSWTQGDSYSLPNRDPPSFSAELS